MSLFKKAARTPLTEAEEAALAKKRFRNLGIMLLVKIGLYFGISYAVRSSLEN